MTEVTETMEGLFLLDLATDSKGMLGAPSLKLRLTVYTPKDRVTGAALIQQATNPPLNLVSDVYGTMNVQTVMGPESKVRFDLIGYPEIHWDPIAGVGPAIPENTRIQLLMDSDFSEGIAVYMYRSDFSGKWNKIEQPIKNTNRNVR